MHIQLLGSAIEDTIPLAARYGQGNYSWFGRCRSRQAF